jgi:AcrR family transcriptional regulator
MKSQAGKIRSPRGRGRPAGESSTREAILESARRHFADRGYQGTTLRAVAASAGVDARLVAHYFGSKAALFQASVQLPVDPNQLIERLFAEPTTDMGHRAAGLLVGLIDDPVTRRGFVSLLRAAVAEPEAAALIREVLAERILVPMASRVGGGQPELRASLISTLLVGLAVSRHIVGFRSLAAMPREQLVNVLAPVVEHYLLGDWLEEPSAVT